LSVKKSTECPPAGALGGEGGGGGGKGKQGREKGRWALPATRCSQGIAIQKKNKRNRGKTRKRSSIKLSERGERRGGGRGGRRNMKYRFHNFEEGGNTSMRDEKEGRRTAGMTPSFSRANKKEKGIPLLQSSTFDQR